MLRPGTMLLAVLTAAPSAACTHAEPVGPATQTDETRLAMMQAAPPAPDIAGEWIYSERIWVLQPSELNDLIGAPQVDKPMTQVVCRARGAMSIEQDGSTFEGTATQEVICSVDGVAFVPPEFAFNPEFTVFNGSVHGRSIRFETGHTLNVCVNRGSAEVIAGVVESMNIVGSCPLPFHPGEGHSSWSIVRVPSP